MEDESVVHVTTQVIPPGVPATAIFPTNSGQTIPCDKCGAQVDVDKIDLNANTVLCYNCFAGIEPQTPKNATVPCDMCKCQIPLEEVLTRGTAVLCEECDYLHGDDIPGDCDQPFYGIRDTLDDDEGEDEDEDDYPYGCEVIAEARANFTCLGCGKGYETSEAHRFDSVLLCKDCYESVSASSAPRCFKCGAVVETEKMLHVGDLYFCADCLYVNVRVTEMYATGTMRFEDGHPQTCSIITTRIEPGDGMETIENKLAVEFLRGLLVPQMKAEVGEPMIAQSIQKRIYVVWFTLPFVPPCLLDVEMTTVEVRVPLDKNQSDEEVVRMAQELLLEAVAETVAVNDVVISADGHDDFVSVAKFMPDGRDA